MVVFPVVERELRVAARGHGIYRVRFWPLLIMLGIFLSFLHASAVVWPNASAEGRQLMTLLTVPAFAFSLGIGIFATADCVSSEKRNGTLGLLFLTDLSGWDVIFGKLAANSLNAIYGLLAIMPVLSVPVMLGGVTFPQYLRLVIVLFTNAVFSLTAGIFVSTFSRNERKAMFFTLLLLASATALPFLLTSWYSQTINRIPGFHFWQGFFFSPAYALGPLLSGIPVYPPASYWLSTAWQWVVILSMLALASSHVAHSWEHKPARKPRPDAKQASVKSRQPAARAWLDRNPFVWLALQGEEASPGRVWFFVLAILAIWGVAVLKFGMNFLGDEEVVTYTILVLHLPLKIWIAAEASRRFSEDRSTNAFELILSTPLQAREIVAGQTVALLKQFAAPLALVLLWEGAMEIHWPASHNWWHRPDFLDYWPSMIVLVADAAALAGLGMWLGLKCKGRVRAIFGNTALVLFLPWALTYIMTETFLRPMLLGIGWGTWNHWRTAALLFTALLVDIPLILLAGPALVRNLRRLAAA